LEMMFYVCSEKPWAEGLRAEAGTCRIYGV
jgi:hypothetical protein